MENIEKIKTITIADEHPLFTEQGMFTKEFPSDLRQLKFFTGIIMQKVPHEIKGRVLLEKQISELIINAIKHGNKLDKSKKVGVRFTFTPEKAHLIVSDEGKGFIHLEKWNEFYKKHRECLLNEDYENMGQYSAFKTEDSSPEDRGQSLIQAVEFWNGGIVFSKQKNRVAVLKKYPRKNPGISLRK